MNNSSRFDLKDPIPFTLWFCSALISLTNHQLLFSTFQTTLVTQLDLLAYLMHPFLVSL